MAISRYRIIDEKGAYMPRSPELHVLALGSEHADASVLNIRGPRFELLRQGEEIEFAGTPGPHLEPLNEEAREAMAAYWAKFPNATLDPTRHMPAGQDPMGGKTVEQLVTGLLEAMDQERAADRSEATGAPVQAASGSPELAALMAGQLAMQEAILKMVEIIAMQAAHPLVTAPARGTSVSGRSSVVGQRELSPPNHGSGEAPNETRGRAA